MATVDELIVRIDADLSSLKRELGKTKQIAQQSTRNIQNNVNRTGRSFSGLTETVRRLGPILATVAGGFIIRNFVRTGASVERLQIQLEALFGSAEEGAKAFDVLTKFASKVPFTLQEIQQGTSSLAAVTKNAEELSAVLQITGNVAATFNMSFADTASQIQRAFSSGIAAADIFREKGVTGFLGFQKGAEVSVAKTIEVFSENFGEGGKFANATDKMSNTFDGTLSMLQDAIFKFSVAVAQSGLMDSLKDLINFLKQSMQGSDSLAKKVGSTLGVAFKLLTLTLKVVLENLQSILLALSAIIAVRTIAGIVAVGRAFLIMGKAIKNTKNIMTLFNKSMKTNVLTLAAVGAVFLADKAGAFDKALSSAAKSLDKVFGTDAGGKVTDNTEEISNAIDKLKGRIKDTATGTGLGNAFKKINDDIKTARLELLGFDKELIKVIKSEKLLDNVSIISTTRKKDIGTVLGDPVLQGISDEDFEKLKKLTKQNKELRDQIDKRNASFENAKNFVDGLASEESQLIKTQNDLKLALDEGKITNTEYAKGIKEIETQIMMTNPMFASFVQAIDGVGQSVADSLAEAFTKGKLSLDNFKDIFRDFVQQMLSQALRLMFINKLINAALGTTGTSNALPTANFPTGASGGSMQRKTPTIVGERGPELFIPNTGGVLKNNADTKNLMGSGKTVVVNQYLNFATGVSQTVRAEVLGLMPLIKDQTLNAVVDQKQRGGAFAQALS